MSEKVRKIPAPLPEPAAGLACMFCGEKKMKFQDGGPPNVEPWFRCFACNVRVQVTNFSDVPISLRTAIWAVRFRKSRAWRAWRQTQSNVRL